MKRALWSVPLLLSLAVATSGVAGAADGATDGAVRRVLVVTYPATTWERVLETNPPVLRDLLATGAVASASLRTIGPATSSGEAYVTIGAGNRAGVEERAAGLALAPDTEVEGDTAEQVFERRCGCSAGDATVVHLAMPRINRKNDRFLYGAEPGALADALRDAGRHTAVVANADQELGAVDSATHREAALAMVDGEGRVTAGSVDTTLLRKDPKAPFGLRTDVEAAADAVHAAWSGADVVLLEMSDLARVEAYTPLASEDAVVGLRATAMAHADRLLARALRDIDLERDLVVVVGPTGPRGHGAQLGIAGIAGIGIEPGVARSATTRRPGYVTLQDVAATVLDAFGVELPDTMTGNAIVSAGGGAPTDGTLAGLEHDNVVARFRDRATGPISATFVTFQVLTYGLAALALVRWSRMRRVVAFLALITLAQPPLAFLSHLVPYHDLTVPGYVAAFFAVGALVAWLATVVGEAIGRRIGPAGAVIPPLLLIGTSLLVLLVDVVLGSPMQMNTVFGYSPTVAGRFAGWGNLAFALVASTSIVVATGGWGIATLRGWDGRRATILAAVFFAVIVVCDGLPTLGSDVGGVLALVPAAAVVIVLLSGRTVSWPKAAAIAAGTVAVLCTFALIDLSRPRDERTHLGRLAAKVLDADGGGLATTLARKINANINILTSSIWTWIIPVAILFGGFLVWRRASLLQPLEARLPGFRAGLVGALVAAFLGFALNDSGVAVPAMMLAVVLPYVTYLVVRTSDP
jgi:hypothetical protein